MKQNSSYFKQTVKKKASKTKFDNELLIKPLSPKGIVEFPPNSVTTNSVVAPRKKQNIKTRS